MSKNEWKKWIGGIGRMLLAFALVCAPSAWAGQSQQTKNKTDSPQKAATQQTGGKQSSLTVSPEAPSKRVQGEESETSVAEEKPSRDGSHEGIKVHGHWTIEVRDPDGTLVTHREFENALNPSTGASLLSGCLANGCAKPQWWIALSANGPVASICSVNVCFFSASANLSQTGTSLVVNGTITASNAGGINVVQSATGSAQVGFTITGISNLAVAPGQIVQVNIVITFS